MPEPAMPPPPPPSIMTVASPITTSRRLSRPRPKTSSIAAIVWAVAGLAIVVLVGFLTLSGQHLLFLADEAKVVTRSKAAERKGKRPKPIARATTPSAAEELPLEPETTLPASNEPPKSEEKPSPTETRKEAAQIQSAQDERLRNERKKLLDKLFDEQGGRTRELTRIRDARQAAVASISDRIEKMKTKAGLQSKVVGGVRVTKLPKNLDNVERLERSLKPLEASLKDAKRELNDAEVELSALEMTYWLKEREILNEHRLSTEPKFQRYRGLLYTDAELAQVETYLAAYATPAGAADHYAATLIDSGVIQAAQRTDAFESAFGTGVRYRVQYVRAL